ncbi:hypothetical protein P389DRAFT_177146 [Cystobasidium minutum MCA 4210]|uniref:uncharacterized protein n=1 Tax=Cystobasidium minutum MCA 4210 TaxID=1397322 RepID=UPI0034CE00B7|eukprot:jgi/Rhomi1/177146/fgenesh1_pg.1_\
MDGSHLRLPLEIQAEIIALAARSYPDEHDHYVLSGGGRHSCNWPGPQFLYSILCLSRGLYPVVLRELYRRIEIDDADSGCTREVSRTMRAAQYASFIDHIVLWAVEIPERTLGVSTSSFYSTYHTAARTILLKSRPRSFKVFTASMLPQGLRDMDFTRLSSLNLIGTLSFGEVRLSINLCQDLLEKVFLSLKSLHVCHLSLIALARCNFKSEEGRTGRLSHLRLSAVVDPKLHINMLATRGDLSMSDFENFVKIAFESLFRRFGKQLRILDACGLQDYAPSHFRLPLCDFPSIRELSLNLPSEVSSWREEMRRVTSALPKIEIIGLSPPTESYGWSSDLIGFIRFLISSCSEGQHPVALKEIDCRRLIRGDETAEKWVKKEGFEVKVCGQVRIYLMPVGN